MRIVECIQGTDEWKQARCGRITASRIADVLSYLKKGGESAARRDYRVELMAERLTGKWEEKFVTPEMRWGTDQEKYARAAYTVETGRFLDEVGFVLHPKFDFAGCSPDGLWEGGGIQIKCPKTTTHIGYMLAGVVPEDYVPQMLWEMRCSDRQWLDFVSFDPRMPEDLQLFIVRLERDDAKISEMEAEVIRFEAEINFQIESLKELCTRQLSSVS
jgi:hypothetical protein